MPVEQDKLSVPMVEVEEPPTRSYTMLVVKPTGMSGDFSDYINFLFDPDARKDSFFNEAASALEATYSPKYRQTFRDVLDKTTIEASFYGAFEPEKPPYFWEANYFKRNGGKFYYGSLLDGFRGGKTVEIFLLNSTAPQEELDNWVVNLKGRETLLKPQSDPEAEPEVLYQGYGIRGLVDVEAIMLDEPSKSELLSKLDPDRRQQVNEELREVSLPIIFSRLSHSIQSALWPSLAPEKQQAMISNFIHCPDDIKTTFAAVKSLAKQKLTDEEIERICASETSVGDSIYALMVDFSVKR